MHKIINIFRSKQKMFQIEGGRKSFDADFINLLRDREKAKEVYSMVKNSKAKNLFDSDGTHLLHLAAKYDNYRLIKLLIEKSEWDIDVEDSSGTTPMITAIMCGNAGVAYHLYVGKKKRLIKQLEENESEFSSFDYYDMVGIPLMNDLISRLRKKGFDNEQIGDVLGKVQCSINDVIRLHDTTITRSYLQANLCWYGFENIFNIVTPKLDFSHVQVLTDPALRLCDNAMHQFCRSLLNGICTYRKSNEGRAFLKKVFSLEFFNESNLGALEVALRKSRRRSVEAFLQLGFHLEIQAKYNRDILLSLFGNRNVDVVSFLQIDKVDVDRRDITYNDYKESYTLLHLAARCEASRNIQSLLDRGADPNTFNENKQTPLDLVGSNENCAKLLLLGGANSLLCENRNHAKTFFGIYPFLLEHYIDVIKVFAADLAIHEEDGQPVEQDREIYTSFNSQELDRFYEECQQQLKILKSHEIRDTWMNEKRALTMFTILSERPEKIARFISAEDLRQIHRFMKCNGKTLNSYYRQALKKYLKDIVEMKRRRNRAIQAICEFTGIRDRHHLVIRKIFDYLSLKDLFYFK